MTQTLSQLEYPGAFIQRHIGPDQTQQQYMLDHIGAGSLADLVNTIVPQDIWLDTPPRTGQATSEHQAGVVQIAGFAES